MENMMAPLTIQEVLMRLAEAEKERDINRTILGQAEKERHEAETRLASVEFREERFRKELENIANAKPSEWGEQRHDFQAWAQNRARDTLATTPKE